MSRFVDIASMALDDCPFYGHTVDKELSSMKIKTTFYNHNVGTDFDPVLHVSYPNSRADQLSYQPTAKLVNQMFETGKMLQASQQYYDFPDGKDDGREVPIDRLRGLEMPDIAQSMIDNESKLAEHKANVVKGAKAMAKEREAEKDAKKEVPPTKEEGNEA